MSDFDLDLEDLLESEEYCLGYQQGRADERKKILGMVNWKQEEDAIRRKIDIHIDFDEMLTTENVLAIIVEQLRERNNG